MTGLNAERRREEQWRGLERAGGCKDAAAPNARFVSTRAMEKESH